MQIACLIATCGDPSWEELAWSRAYPSTLGQGFVETLVLHEPNGTVESARNTGLVYLADRACDLVVMVDADDELAPGYHAALVEAATAVYEDGNAGRALFAPRVQYVTDGDEAVPVFPNRHRPMPPLNHCVIGTAVTPWVVEEVGWFREGYRPWEDYELWLRCLAAGCYVVDVPEAVYRAHVTPDSRSSGLPHRDAVRLANRIHAEHRARTRR